MDAGPDRASEPTPAATLRGDGATGRVVSVLDALARSPEEGLGVRQLAADLGVSRSAVHRILQSLAELGVARALRDGSYQAGPIMASWAAFLAHKHTLLASAQLVMAQVVEHAAETCYLFGYDAGGHALTLVSTVECDKPVRYVLEPGSSAPLHLGAAGKAVLMRLDDDALTRIPLDMSKRKASQFLAGLRADLELSRERGYAVSHGERIPEAIGVAAPFLLDGRVVGSLSITTPRYRMDDDNIAQFGEWIRSAADQLTRLLDAPVTDG